MTFEVIVRGVRELQGALDDVKVEVDPVLGKALRAAAEPVKTEVRRRAEPFSALTAAGVRVRRKGLVVRVEQGQRKTTGYHAQYGALQQARMFDPALAEKQDEVIALSREAMDELAAHVNRLP